MNDRERIGKKISKLRKQKHLTQLELANLSGVTRVDLNRIENAKYSPGLDVLVRIAKELDSKIDIIKSEP
jgi:putative transcriptional regulator